MRIFPGFSRFFQVFFRFFFLGSGCCLFEDFEAPVARCAGVGEGFLGLCLVCEWGEGEGFGYWRFATLYLSVPDYSFFLETVFEMIG